ncbi:MAG: ATP-binding protein [Pseudomonadota bacterium]
MRPLSRTEGRSLHARLALWLGLSLALLVLLHWFVTERAPRVTTEDYIATRLDHDAEWLIEGLMIEQGHAWIDSRRIPPIYQRPGSGHYFTLRHGDERLLSASSLGRELPLPAGDGLTHIQLARIDGAPDHGHMHPRHSTEPLLLLRRSLPDGGVLLLAESLDDLDAHLATFRNRFALLSLGLFLLLLGGQFLLLRWLLRPVRQLEHASERLERGEIDQLPVPPLHELRPLTLAFNRLLTHQASRMERSRHALADLAHALKTPLAVLRQTLPAQGDAQARQALERIEGIVQRELRHARWSDTPTHGIAALDAIPALGDLVHAMHLIHRDRVFEMVAPKTLPLRMEREDLLELLGNLLDNAGKWARSRVRLTLQHTEEGLIATIDDDGPGADPARLNSESPRGQRLDESRPGHGLGLSISRQIVAAHNGALLFSRSPELGGLRVELSLPG